MFKISQKPLEDIELRKGLVSNNTGAFSCFEGWVRNTNDGKKVTALEYEAYESLCNKEAHKILCEAEQYFNVIAARAFHRVGKLNVGEMAVWVGVVAQHREDSFNACRYIIDEVKTRLPIWKKEYYENGESNWIACKTCDSNSSHAHSK